MQLSPAVPGRGENPQHTTHTLEKKGCVKAARLDMRGPYGDRVREDTSSS